MSPMAGRTLGRSSGLPAFNEEAVIADVVSALRARHGWREILVVDDGSTDATRRRVRGARVIRHPYNKGNGAAVKTACARRLASSS